MLVRTFLVGLVAVVAAGKNDRLTTAMTFPPSHSRQSSQVVAAPSPVIGDSSNFSMDRRKCLANCITLPIFTAAASGAGAEEDLKMSQQLASFQVFQVELDDSAALNPKLNLQNVSLAACL